MDSNTRHRHKYCGMGRCKKRLNGTGFRVGASAFWPLFKRYVGESIELYNEETRVCSKCNANIRNLRRVLNATSPTEDPVEFSSENSAATSSVGFESLDASQLNNFELDEGAEVGLESDGESSTQSGASSFPSVKACISTARRCFLCPTHLATKELKRCRLDSKGPALREVWDEMGVFIAITNRCCEMHFDENKMFTPEAKALIRTSNSNVRLASDSLYNWMRKITTPEQLQHGLYDFSENGVLAEKYPHLVGIKKEQFDDLITYVEPTHRNTECRSVRNALGMYLMFTKTGCSQEHIAYCFQTEQKIVSNAISSISEALYERFVPENLGLGHLSQEEMLQFHSRDTFKVALSLEDGTSVVIADGTYVYIEKPSDIEEQKLTFSGQKNRNFLRYLVLVLPSGHILDVHGPFPATWSDAKILPDIVNGELLEYLGPSPNIILDRGFVRCKSELVNKGFKVFDPEWIAANETQLSTEQGNSSRLVTMCRWPVEATFGRLKQKFRLFMHQIHGPYSKDKITKFFKISCAILNKYHPVGFNENERNIEFARSAVAKSIFKENVFKQELEESASVRLTRKWKKCDETTVPDFPEMTIEELENITFGKYQLLIAKRYVKEHMKNSGYFELRACEGSPNGLVRAQIHSRFQSQKIHSTFVKYDPAAQGTSSIAAYYCTCRAGARVVGCCSHVAAILRYLSLDRHQGITQMRKVNRGSFAIAAASTVSPDEMDLQ